jgi:hypothetical protein
MFHTLTTLGGRKPLKDKGAVSITGENVVTDIRQIFRVVILIFMM